MTSKKLSLIYTYLIPRRCHSLPEKNADGQNWYISQSDWLHHRKCHTGFSVPAKMQLHYVKAVLKTHQILPVDLRATFPENQVEAHFRQEGPGKYQKWCIQSAYSTICTAIYVVIELCRAYRSWDMATLGRPPGLPAYWSRSPSPKTGSLERTGDRNFQHWLRAHLSELKVCKRFHVMVLTFDLWAWTSRDQQR